LIRYHRLKGRDALWIVGTDHAGIATQMVVERRLAASGQDRKAMGRDAFLAEVWAWKAESGGAITQQLRRLGASCDWANERFTMDPGFTVAVTRVFVELYNQKLLYRDKRLVNWDPSLKTAISDLEVEPREVQGSFTHIRYPLADGSGSLVVATTRPETMLGDTAVAVNPADERYAHMVGKMLAHPLTGRQIPVIADDWADPELGSGAVKITPAHDHNDWAVYERHRAIGYINILDDEARIVAAEGVPEKYVGMSREDARAAVVADLDALGLIVGIEAKTIQMPFGDRSGVVIEWWLTDQWYIDAATLAAPAIDAVRSGKTKFVPANWDKTYYNWMENIQPWCVSRQLWWGHRIPAWYGPKVAENGERQYGVVGQPYFIAETEAQAIAQARDLYKTDDITIAQNQVDAINQQLQGNSGVSLFRDPDVLDTWFSSALWPFGTLGWPADTDRVDRYYPGDVLVTGFDIIFFWVARMMMQGIHFMGEVPFATVYCHGLVRDAKGAKMSKSKGNTVDPLDLIDRYGADALRFTLTAMESQGRDIKLDEKRVEGYRNFATKLWNAARFCQSNGISGSTSATPPPATAPVNRWIIAEVVATARALDDAVAAFRFDGYADTAYQFVWSRFCDWYLELTKPLLAEGADEAVARETRSVTGWALDQILVMLHPVMPFLTEELWHKLAPRGDDLTVAARDHDLIVAAWPVTDARLIDASVAAEIDWLIGLVTAVRSARSELNVPPSARLSYTVEGGSPREGQWRLQNTAAIKWLARIDIAEGTAQSAAAKLQVVHGEMIFALDLEGVIDLAAERARLEKNAAAAEKERDALAGRLGSPGFVDKAKPEAVDKARTDHAARAAEATRLRAALARLG
ncbi:MAG: valine--tRNA ligase, partial [Janthinobacterium lividum]